MGNIIQPIINFDEQQSSMKFVMPSAHTCFCQNAVQNLTTPRILPNILPGEHFSLPAHFFKRQK